MDDPDKRFERTITSAALANEDGLRKKALELITELDGLIAQAYWYQWAYIMMCEQPGNSVLVADKLRSLGLPIYSHEIEGR